MNSMPTQSALTARSLLVTLMILSVTLACTDDPKPSGEGDMSAGATLGGDMAGTEGELVLNPDECVTYRYDLSHSDPQTFPDDVLTRADAERPTGLTLDVSALPWVEDQSSFVQQLMTDLDQLDGWGLNAGLLLRFSEPLQGLPSGPETGAPESAVLLVRVDGEEELPLYPRQVPVERREIEGGAVQIFEPMRPLKPATRYALIIRQLDEDHLEGGGCLAQGPEVQALLNGLADRDSHAYSISEALAKAIDVAGVSKSQVAAATIFTTQSTPLLSFEVAAHVRTQSYAWLDEPTCALDGETYTLCTRSFLANDYRAEGVIQDASPKGQHAVKVYFWKPKNRVDERPVILYGHGIGGDVRNGYGVLEMLKEERVSMIAIDAVAHGAHPEAPEGEGDTSFQTVLNFFALNLSTQSIEALRARDNFRQSTYEKLQLIELLHQDADINADGRADLDVSMMSYYGLSLGGIMGVELLALEPRLSAGLLTVPGARLVSVITDGSIIESFIPIIHQLVGGEEAFNTFTPLAQVLIDGADPGSFAPMVLHHRQDDAPAPHLLMQMAIDDETVPNPANRSLARGLGLPHIGPELQKVGLLELREAPASLTLSHEQGARTVGLFQYDRVSRASGEINPASHVNMPYGREASLQAQGFLIPWSEGEEPMIVDPYSALRIP